MSRIFALVATLFLNFFFTFSAHALYTKENYYGKNWVENIEALPQAERKAAIFKMLSKAHIVRIDQADELKDSCSSRDSECFSHESLGYTGARRVLFGQLHLEQEGRDYFITTVYCEKRLGPSDFKSGGRPGPDRIPHPEVINAEHTWPQSRFSRNHSTDMQKSDLHGLFPALPRVNASRGNLEFAEVDEDVQKPCDETARGGTSQDNKRRTFFEPNESHKGNVARALFYFSVRYQMNIDPVEEAFLRKWHLTDPVDEFEAWRNEEIFAIQKVRNPFIDYPELVEKILNY